uniref:RluA family pseudouridine synthase n=1 Tax=Agathobacter sp. TaxID=2021311 RepID=UPI0040566EBA
MRRELTYTITKQFHNKSIDTFLKAQEFPHQAIVQLKKTHEGIKLNGTWAYVTEKLENGDILLLSLIENANSEHITPAKLPLNIVYEDEDILVINKPAGMPVHPSMSHHEGTLANSLMHYFSNQGESFVFRCINRLDRDTSGLTIVAKHSLSGGILSRQVSQKSIQRTYHAICQGKLPTSGTIDRPIGRADDSTIERCVREDGEHAVTHYRLLCYSLEKDLSLAELFLETGRTHQIRVHMKSIGYPIIGDFLYNPDYTYIQRQALHSASLDFVHPITKEKMHFSAPLPRDMKCIFTCV